MAGNPYKVWGQTRITVDGQLLNTEGKGSLEVGGSQASMVDGDFQAGFFSEQVKPSKVECSVLMTAGVSLVSLQSIRNATVVHECDTGQTYVVRNAVVVDAVAASEGKAKVTLQGPPAEEELA